jgi:hypothetical protein
MPSSLIESLHPFLGLLLCQSIVHSFLIHGENQLEWVSILAWAKLN